MRYTVRPLSDRTWLRPDRARVYSQFDSTWTATLTLLGKEIEHLKGRDVVIESDIREQDLKLDGTFRANARQPVTPAVVIAFESKHGPMLYRSDQYSGRWGMPGWQCNVRAVALTLQALRAVDRYGATETGQQYAGFKALPAGRAMPASHMTTDEAWSIIGSYQGTPIARFRVEHSADELARAYRAARIANHPDKRDGDHSLWTKVEEAGRVLGVAK